MIHTLFYISQDEFEADYRAEIYEQSAQLAEDYPWWMEPLWLFDKLSYPHHLTGQSQLFRHDPTDIDDIPILGSEIPYRDNALMGYIDLQRIVALLQLLSEQHAITWSLSDSHSGDGLGKIANGDTDAHLERTLEHIRVQNNFPEKQLLDHALHQRIRDKHLTNLEQEEYDRAPEYLPPEQEIEPHQK